MPWKIHTSCSYSMKPQPQILTKKLSRAYRDEQMSNAWPFSSLNFPSRGSQQGGRWLKECQIDTKRHKKYPLDISSHYDHQLPFADMHQIKLTQKISTIQPSSFLQCVVSPVSLRERDFHRVCFTWRVSQAGSMVLHGLRTSSPSWCQGKKNGYRMRGSMCEDRMISDCFRKFFLRIFLCEYFPCFLNALYIYTVNYATLPET